MRLTHTASYLPGARTVYLVSGPRAVALTGASSQQTQGRRTPSAVRLVLQDDPRINGRDTPRTYYERVQVDRSENAFISRHEPLKLESHVNHPVRREPVAPAPRQNSAHLRGHQRVADA